MIDVRVEPDEAVEVLVEQRREDIEQAINIRSRHGDIQTLARRMTSADDFDDDDGLGFEQVAILAEPERRVELGLSSDSTRTLQVWNTWLVGEAQHAWTGNSGIVVEELDAPGEVSQRLRLWCSDGLGDPSFDDLVLVLTVGPRSALDVTLAGLAIDVTEEE